MPKQSQTIRHIANRAELVGEAEFLKRLYYPFIRDKSKVNYAQLAALITQDDEVHNYLVDTNLFARHEVDQCFWDALLAKRVTFTKGVWDELEPWRNNPFYNAKALDLIESAKRNSSTTILFDGDVQWGMPCGTFRNWYVNLLVQRKRKAVDVRDKLFAQHGREPTTEELTRLLQMAGTDRDLPIFRKGLGEIDNNKNWATDEELVCTAAMIALASGRNVTILTRDQDVLDQFYCLTGQLTCHYQSTLFGDRYADDPTPFPAEPMPRTKDTEYYFHVADSFLVSKPVHPESFTEWLLPAECEPVHMKCVLLTGQGDGLAVTPLIFIGETGMYRLLEAKGLTYGRNTDRLIDRNCHVTGLPIGCERSKIAIVRDQLFPTLYPETYFARLDIARAPYDFGLIKTLGPPPKAVAT